jgi:NAD-dependent deacetylase
MASDDIDETLRGLISKALGRPGACLFLTGAGVSAESGVPTFRGKDGYWVVGSRNYHAQELATRAAFARMPDAVWGWYLHRLRVCRDAQPNDAHIAIAELAAALRDRFLLITQNVDGLHLRAGSPRETTYEVHGNISLMRCSAGCGGLVPVPDGLISPVSPPGKRQLETALRCSVCSAWMRPHVLWFDEFYDETLFRFESSLRAADDAALLVVVGTTGTTNLPLQIGERAARRAAVLVINPEPNPFSELARTLPEGGYLRGQAGRWVPRVANVIRAAAE